MPKKTMRAVMNNQMMLRNLKQQMRTRKTQMKTPLQLMTPISQSKK
jgi:hypothetical protein